MNQRAVKSYLTGRTPIPNWVFLAILAWWLVNILTYLIGR